MAKKAILLIFIVLVIFSAIYALWDKKEVTTSSDQAYHAFKTGESLWKKLYYKDAIPEFEKAIKIDTNFAMAYSCLAELYKSHDRQDDAKIMIEKAVSLFPLITEREQLLIKTMEASISGNHDSLAKSRQNFIDNYPDDLYAYMFSAEQYKQKQDIDSAIKEYKKMIDKDPGYALAYNMLGYLYYWNRNFDNALIYIKQYSMLAEKEANPHDSYGEILMYLGRYDEAIKEFETANKIKPDLVFVLNHLGLVHSKIGRYRDAVGYYERAKDNVVGKNRVTMIDEQIAFVYYLAGKSKKAIEILDEIEKEGPCCYSVMGLRCYILANSDEIEKAEANLEIVKSHIAEKYKNSDDANAKENADRYITILKSEIALEKGMYDEAISGFQTVINSIHLPDQLDHKLQLGKAYLYKGDLDRAEEILLSNLEDNPNHPLSLFYLARVNSKKGDTAKQMKSLQRYLSVMSGADDDAANVITARAQLDSLTAM